jgi:hypothetical protein
MIKKSSAPNRFCGFTAAYLPWYKQEVRRSTQWSKTDPCGFRLSKVRFQEIEVTRNRDGNTGKVKRYCPPWLS